MEAAFWQTLTTSAPAEWLQRSAIAYLLVNAAHIASLGLLIGTVVMLDLRLLGAFAALPLRSLGRALLRMAATGLALAAATGAWLFSVNAVEYVGNPALQVKLVLISLALLNLLLLHRRGWTDEPPSAAVRVHAVLSLALWLSVLVAGRWIGFA